MTENKEPPQTSPLTKEETTQCLQTLEQLISLPHLADDDEQVYAIFQKAQKFYKSVKKYRKYEKKKKATPSTRPISDKTSVRFQHPLEESSEQKSQENQENQESTAPRGKCYICRALTDKYHSIYNAMCEPCGEICISKRTRTADLHGRTAIVTGGRIKIGFQVACKLLRCGAKVIVTTRFPNDAAKRFADLEDHQKWSERLHIYGLDLRHMPSIETFSEWFSDTHQTLDILVNNAAQTVRRPPAFYHHLLEVEKQPIQALPPAQQRTVVATKRLTTAPNPSTRQLASFSASTSATLGEELDALQIAHSVVPLSVSLSQLSLLEGEEHDKWTLFPEGQFDEDGQQRDLRKNNSWLFRLPDIPSVELWEVHMINAMAPFILFQRLEPCLHRAAAQHKFVINVTSSEGQFMEGGRKTSRHPHTNMSKAALNMLTRTCAKEYAKDDIYLNSVDPGWMSLGLPYLHIKEYASQGFALPVDAVDGAARICDPIFEGVETKAPTFGKLWKDFREVSW